MATKMLLKKLNSLFSREGDIQFSKNLKIKIYKTINAKEDNISSTEIRRRLREGESVSGMLPARIEKYIIKNNLYSGGAGK